MKTRLGVRSTKNAAKMIKPASDIASVKKLIVKKNSILESKETDETDKETKEDERPIKIGEIKFAKTFENTSSTWFKMCMDAFPAQELEKFYRQYLGMSVEEKFDILECREKYERDYADFLKMTMEINPGTTSFPTFPRVEMDFFGFNASIYNSFCKEWDFEKRITFDEFTSALLSTSCRDTGRSFYDLGLEKDVVVEFYLD
jgi:hypothetical protein